MAHRALREALRRAAFFMDSRFFSSRRQSITRDITAEDYIDCSLNPAELECYALHVFSADSVGGY
jgi:hypothetical protein